MRSTESGRRAHGKPKAKQLEVISSSPDEDEKQRVLYSRRQQKQHRQIFGNFTPRETLLGSFILFFLALFLAITVVTHTRLELDSGNNDNDASSYVKFNFLHPRGRQQQQQQEHQEEVILGSNTSDDGVTAETTTTCVVVGMLSRSTDFRLREWQRKKFLSEVENHLLLGEERIHVQLRFSIGYNSDNSTVMDQVYKEQKEHGDLFLLRIQENYKWLVGNTFEMLKQAVHIMDDDKTCGGGKKYIVKTDDDVFVSFERLIQVILAMPVSSTYFGLLVPNLPTHDLLLRTTGDFAYSYMPLWAVGQMYGMSYDVAKEIIRPEVERTVLKRDHAYLFPEEDRAIGLAMARSQLNVQNRLFLKGLYFFCLADNFNCKDYGRAISVGVGFGMSGEGEAKVHSKLRVLEQVRNTYENCVPEPDYKVGDQFFLIDEKFLKSSPLKWLFYGCAGLNEEGRSMLEDLKNKLSIASFDYVGREEQEYQCSENMYRYSHPEVDQQIRNGIYSSGKDHYLKWGHKSSLMHYICPPDCFNEISAKKCASCNKEDMYLRNNPDIEAAVHRGEIKSGVYHWEHWGRFEGRSNSCYQRVVEEGIGNTTGCLEVFERFVNATTQVVSHWPVAGRIPADKRHSDTCKAVLLAEGRLHKWLDYVLRVHRRYTGPDWMFYLVGPPRVAKKWRKLYSGPMVKIIALPEQFGDLSRYPLEYNNLLRSKYLWKEVIQCEHVLLTQTDSLLLRHGVEDFLEYAYVGSPVYPESFPNLDWRYLCTQNRNCGGNGGLSLRRRSESLRALESCSVPQDLYDEDVWYSACLAEIGTTKYMPHPMMANRFSTGSKCISDSPFGVHKLWQNCKESTCAVTLLNSRLYQDIYGDASSLQYCKEGDMHYHMSHDDVRKSGMESWLHYQKTGYREGRKWRCFTNITEDRNNDHPFENLPDKGNTNNNVQNHNWVAW